MVALYAGNPTGHEREVAGLVRSVSAESLVHALQSPYSDDRSPRSNRSHGTFADLAHWLGGDGSLKTRIWDIPESPYDWTQCARTYRPVPRGMKSFKKRPSKFLPTDVHKRERNNVIDISWSCNKSGGV